MELVGDLIQDLELVLEEAGLLEMVQEAEAGGGVVVVADGCVLLRGALLFADVDSIHQVFHLGLNTHQSAALNHLLNHGLVLLLLVALYLLHAGIVVGRLLIVRCLSDDAVGLSGIRLFLFELVLVLGEGALEFLYQGSHVADA